MTKEFNQIGGKWSRHRCDDGEEYVQREGGVELAVSAGAMFEVLRDTGLFSDLEINLLREHYYATDGIKRTLESLLR